jgi:exonuclease SbcD
MADGVGDDFLRIELDEPARAGLAEEVRAIMPGAVEVRLAGVNAQQPTEVPRRLGRDPGELFREYLVSRNIRDDRLEALFDELAAEL